jgi:hypothetical protein
VRTDNHRFFIINKNLSTGSKKGLLGWQYIRESAEVGLGTGEGEEPDVSVFLFFTSTVINPRGAKPKSFPFESDQR